MPRLVMLVAVVDGTPHVIGSLCCASDQRYGAVSGKSCSRFQPSPSTRNTTYDVLGGRPSVLAQPGAPSAAIALGRTSLSERARTGAARGASTWHAQGWTVAALRAAANCRTASTASGTVGAGADPQREVLGGQRAGVAVVGHAVGVTAGRGLEVEPAYGAPAHGQHRLGHGGVVGRAGRRRVGDHPGHRHAAELVEPARPRWSSRRTGCGQQVVGRVLVGVRHDQPGRREHREPSHGGVPRLDRTSARGGSRSWSPAHRRQPPRPPRATTVG